MEVYTYNGVHAAEKIDRITPFLHTQQRFLLRKQTKASIQLCCLVYPENLFQKSSENVVKGPYFQLLYSTTIRSSEKME